jgi:UDP-glucuronate decarboxylase
MRMRNEQPQKVLVAGGAGFLGSHLCERLIAAGHEVVCLDNFLTGQRANLRSLTGRARFELVEADVIDPLPAKLLKREFSRIYNLACAASPPLYQADPEHTLLTSVLGAHRLLRLAEETGARLLMASTSEVYGDPDFHPQPETYRGSVSCTGPRACYDEGKRAAETLCFDYDRSSRAQVRVARIFNTYGPRLAPSDGRVVSNLIRQALAGEDITVFGDGSQTRSFCYVADLIDGLTRLMEFDGPQPGPVNLGNPVERTVLDLVDLVLAITGSESSVAFRPLPADDPRRRRPDIAKAERLLGWRPATRLIDGLRATVAWFESAGRAERPAAAETARGARVA